METTQATITTVPMADTGDEPTESGGDPTEDEPTGGPYPGCDGIELAQDGVLDLDVPAATYVIVSGTLTLNGGALPDADGPRGSLLFEVVTGGRTVSVVYALADAGPEDYEVVLPAGSVTVRFVPDAAVCAASPEGPLPCTGGPIAAGLAIAEDGVLDLDIPAVVVSGKVTQDGGALPDADGDRGHLEFVRDSGEVVASAGFEAAGAFEYSLALFPGTYDVVFAGNAGLCAEGAAPVPCNRGVVAPKVGLQATGVLDVDVKRVEVGGKVLVNGKAIADGEADRGSLRFDGVDAPGAGLATPAFGATGAVEYAVSLVAGTYAVVLVANAGQCDGEAPPSPCVGGPVLAAVSLADSGALDVDIPMIAVTGKVTLAGGGLPTLTQDRGAVTFTRDSGEGTAVALESEGAIDYVLALLPGDYAIAYAANPGLCDGETAPALPCSSGPLVSRSLAMSGTLDVDVPVVKIAGKVTLNGAALPEQAIDRGSVVFAAEAGTVAVALGTEALGDYAVSLLPGAYDVVYAGGGTCEGPPDDRMPCGGGRLAGGVALAMDGVLDVDIPAVAISGSVGYAGGALPDLEQGRGGLRWTRVDGSAGPVLDLEAAGAKQYAVSVVPGRWIVDLAANPELCADGAPAFPCTDQVVVGCD